ncbi:LuxR C-terminal-related transcriptional regulator [Streptomyces sp. NPDC005181]|uniref:LuxR C-terminal-related transcriptional regulator n=1 Tax=Streptomyces sp. NPDC005181 TaxID=3156869 RepID=UPI0033B13A36
MTTTATEATTAQAAVVSFDQVSKVYGDVRAVDGLSLYLHPGETVALLGPNGAGKSSTLDLLLGLRTADSGTVRLFGTSPQEAIARGRVGAMLQSGGLMEDVTVEEIVRLVCDLHAPASQLAEAVRKVLAGERVIDPTLAAAALADGASPLTERERDVLCTAADGSTNAEIATTLHLSHGTVRNYLSTAIQKMAARNRAEAVRIASEKGWL